MLSALLPDTRLAAKCSGTLNSCWLWTGSRNPSGYGKVTRQNRQHLVHRVVYEHFCGPVPAGLELDHLCRNRACGNPMHLELVTPTENDRRRQGAKAHCPHGHPYTPENTYRHPNGSPVCRTCKRSR